MREHIERNNLDEADYPILSSQPELFPDLKWIWEGFHILSSSRQRGFSSLQPLFYSEIVKYMDENHYVGEDRDYFMQMIQFMDRTFLEELDKKKPKK